MALFGDVGKFFQKNLFGGGDSSSSGMLGTGAFSAGDSRFLQLQENQAQRLIDRAEGKAGPSLAELLLQEEQDKNLKRQQALLAGSSLSPALRARLLSRQQSAGAGEISRQGARLRAQEQMEAEKTLAQVLASARGQDVQMESQKRQAFESGAQRRQGLLKAAGEALGVGGG